MDEYQSQYQPIKKTSRHGYTYEHFPVVCPTCEGRGEIDGNGESGMVTFVPVKDERLRPAWLKLKIGILVFILFAGSGLATYFLYPRGVIISLHSHKVMLFDFKESPPWIDYTFTMQVKNDNFFDVGVSKLAMQLSYMLIIVYNQSVPQTIHVPLRSSREQAVRMKVTYNASKSEKYLQEQCFRKRYVVAQLLKTSGKLSYWIHSQHIESKDDYFYLDCSQMIFPEPTRITTSTTTVQTMTTTANTTATAANTTSATAGPITAVKQNHESTTKPTRKFATFTQYSNVTSHLDSF